MINPFDLFKKWHSEEIAHTALKLPNACCLSTIGLDSYPNSRFVSLKEVSDDSFIITGSLGSRKGKEMEINSKVALSFWWATTERQVRIQGDASLISTAKAKYYFKNRSRDSKIVSSIFEAGEESESIAYLQQHFAQQKEELDDKEIEMPKNWGGIHINPVRIEFMDFKENRLHERELFKRINESWEKVILQP
jgi:pyridoxamine 5'-phosphate oxidase